MSAPTKEPAHHLNERCYRELRSLVLRGEFLPGQHVTESEPGRRFGIGRTPIREAISRLQQDGLFRNRDERGVCVAESNWAEIPDLYDLCLQLETLAVRWMAECRGPEDLTALNQAWSRASAETGKPLGTDDEIGAGFGIHETVVQPVHSPFLGETLLQLYARMFRFMWIDASQVDNRLATQSKHEAIVVALRDQEPNRAEQVIVLHVERARRNVLRLVGGRRRFLARAG